MCGAGRPGHDAGREPHQRVEAAGESLIRGVLIRTVEATGWLTEADEAVAAAALIAAQCPGGAPVDTPCGPETPMPVLASELRALADEALAHIADDEEGTGSNWVAQDDRKRWRATLARLCAVLAPPPPSLAPFDAQP
ncbi:DUF4259 domain-containing protein [Streptomyces virginiae]|uniref:DUF4259 domain-containing protein n=1 Tax=Streptomyces virginiae TaxID=1961 RepID=UPI00324C90F7